MNSYPVLCGSVAGHPSKVGQAVHNAAYQGMGLPFTYVAFGSRAEPEAIVSAVRTLGLRGLAVTMPYKETIMPHLDRVDAIAAEIGAVNTIVNDDNILTGYNVDWVGVVDALQHHRIDVAGKNAIVAGAGGAARAVAFGLKQRGAGSIRIYNRTRKRGEQLASSLGVDFGGGLEDIPASYDILIHATSAGHFSQPDLCVVGEECLHEGAVVFDVVAEPLDTPLLERARGRGATTLAGYHMRLHQAAAQVALYTNRQPPLAVMEAALLKAMGLAR